MASAAWHHQRAGVWRFSPSDAMLVVLAGLHAAILALWPVTPLIAAGVWWNSNTIAHNFIHRPFFRSRATNTIFACFLSVLLGIPQALWRDRHLAHHAGVEWRLHLSRRLIVEGALVFSFWAVLVSVQPRFFLTVYIPGYLAGLGLCAIQGHWEHAGGRPISHYGHTYNLLCFNDGYHAEHHAAPATHWTILPYLKETGAAHSHFPPIIRWLDVRPLLALERLVLRSPRLQRFVLRVHRQAVEALVAHLPTIRSVTIVGGGLYPRTALILRELLPAAHLTIVESDPINLETARSLLGGDIEYRNERFVAGESCNCDLTVIPLCFDGLRAAIYRCPPSPSVLVHDWIWRRRGTGAVVSAAMLKRLNLVRR
ncbi:MAG TPA: fatty acid desaturase [Bryobacteraceae bacterium]|nr:fatty acid desaturase [Bryobacteraceae bacterium]